MKKRLYKIRITYCTERKLHEESIHRKKNYIGRRLNEEKIYRKRIILHKEKTTQRRDYIEGGLYYIKRELLNEGTIQREIIGGETIQREII